ncbi:hypothetical protein LXL04_002809 [Taraxacum kok-saghyz]
MKILIYDFTPVIAVPVHAQANGRRYHGDLAIMKSPNAYEVKEIKTDFHAFTLSISNTFEKIKNNEVEIPTSKEMCLSNQAKTHALRGLFVILLCYAKMYGICFPFDIQQLIIKAELKTKRRPKRAFHCSKTQIVPLPRSPSPSTPAPSIDRDMGAECRKCKKSKEKNRKTLTKTEEQMQDQDTLRSTENPASKKREASPRENWILKPSNGKTNQRKSSVLRLVGMDGIKPAVCEFGELPLAKVAVWGTPAANFASGKFVSGKTPQKVKTSYVSPTWHSLPLQTLPTIPTSLKKESIARERKKKCKKIHVHKWSLWFSEKSTSVPKEKNPWIIPVVSKKYINGHSSKASITNSALNFPSSLEEIAFSFSGWNPSKPLPYRDEAVKLSRNPPL